MGSRHLLALLFVANTVNVGADLAAMGEAAKLVTGLNQHAFTIFFTSPASIGSSSGNRIVPLDVSHFANSAAFARLTVRLTP